MKYFALLWFILNLALAILIKEKPDILSENLSAADVLEGMFWFNSMTMCFVVSLSFRENRHDN